MSFLTELRYEDLLRLREIVKKVHMAHHPAHLFNTREADKIIESLGPEVIERLLKRAIDNRMIG